MLTKSKNVETKQKIVDTKRSFVGGDMEDGFTLAQAKRDFHLGFLKGYRVDRSALGGGWSVFLNLHGSFFPIVDARDRKARLFKSLDSAISALESVGFEVRSLRA